MNPRTVSAAAALYLHAMRRTHAKATRANYRTALHSFSQAAGNRPLDRIGPALIEDWLNGHAWTAATRRTMLSHVTQFFEWTTRRGWTRTNPARQVTPPRLPRRVPRALPNQHAAQLLAACPDQRARTIVTLMLQQGLRCVEVSRLEAGDIDWVRQTMRIVGKGGHERWLPLLAPTAAELRALGAPQAGPVIRSYTTGEGLGRNTISRMVSRICWEAGIKSACRDGVSAHAARHTMATDMLLGGAQLLDVSAALGHAHLSSTQVYLPHQTAGLAAAMDGRTYGT